MESFPGLVSLEILHQIRKDLEAQQINPEQFAGRILFVSMFNDVDWTKRNSSDCVSNSEKVRDFARRFPRGHWTLFGPGEESEWYGTHIYKPEGEGNEVADLVVDNIKESGHPTFRGISALNRGILKRKVEDLRFTI